MAQIVRAKDGYLYVAESSVGTYSEATLVRNLIIRPRKIYENRRLADDSYVDLKRGQRVDLSFRMSVGHAEVLADLFMRESQVDFRFVGRGFEIITTGGRIDRFEPVIAKIGLVTVIYHANSWSITYA